MKLPFRRRSRWLLLSSAVAGLCLTVSGQSQISAPPVVEAAAMPTNLPRLPVLQPRTEIFRKVLAMTPAEREAWLTNRPSQSRALLEAKINDYEAMDPATREAVLHATELHEYLDYFIKAPAANRESQVDQIPLEYRKTVTEKLREFQILPPELQKEVLEGKSTADYFLNSAPAPMPIRRPPHPVVPPPPMPPEPLVYLSRLSPEQRRNMFASFEHFFDLDSDDQQKILATLPPTTRGPVEKTLHDLESLPAEQRERGLHSIITLAAMTDEQRQAFFENAQTWQQLPPAERQTWRKVVVHLPPLPPMPPLPAPRDRATVATNPAN